MKVLQDKLEFTAEVVCGGIRRQINHFDKKKIERIIRKSEHYQYYTEEIKEQLSEYFLTGFSYWIWGLDGKDFYDFIEVYTDNADYRHCYAAMEEVYRRLSSNPFMKFERDYAFPIEVIVEMPLPIIFKELGEEKISQMAESIKNYLERKHGFKIEVGDDMLLLEEHVRRFISLKASDMWEFKRLLYATEYQDDKDKIQLFES